MEAEKVVLFEDIFIQILFRTFFKFWPKKDPKTDDAEWIWFVDIFVKLYFLKFYDS